jgi:hypothetical protein
LNAGGLTFKITTTCGTVLQVHEIQFATVASLKRRIAELSHYQPDMMHVLVEANRDDGGLPVAQLHAFSPSWQWPADKCVKVLHDDVVLASLGSNPDQHLYLLTKLAVLKDTPVFVEANGKAFVAVRQAAQFFRKPLPSLVKTVGALA